MALLGYGAKVLSGDSWPLILQGAGDPTGVTTPNFVGQHYISSTGDVYTATGLTSADWLIGMTRNDVSFNPIANSPANPREGMFWIPQA
jgi:hypothetical protein